MILIQPKIKEPLYAELAAAENLHYELLELSFAGWKEKDLLAAENYYQASGRTASVHGAFIDLNPVSADPLIREASILRFRESCKLALRLGAKYVVFHGSCYPFLRGAYMDRWAAMSAEFYCELADDYGLPIMIENSQDLDTTPLRELMKRLDELHCKSIGVCLDIGHANLSRQPVKQWFDELGDWIGYLHLSDNAGQFDDHMPLGSGTIDMQEVFAEMKFLKPDIPKTLEVGGIKEIKQSLLLLKENGIIPDHK